MAMNNRLENELGKAFESGQLPGLHSVLIMHKGEILAEQYFPGEDECWGKVLGIVQPDASSLHDLRSVTKSVVSLLYGIALSDGLVPKLDEGLTAQFPEYGDLAADPARRGILVRHALTMQMGTEWSEDLPYTDPRNSEIAMERAADRHRFALDRPMVGEPGGDWTYNGGATAIIACLIAKGVGKPIDIYARETLFSALGIENYEWITGSDGVPVAASGLRLTIHDLAKIGKLIIDNGAWQSKQIVPADWLTDSMTPYADLPDGLRYGFFWWLAPDGSPPHWVAGIGNGGQMLMINPATQLIVVVFTGNYNQLDAGKLASKIITDFALPAVRSK
jgi:CubicO group peptidase (beta-lactamase class C family)